MRARASKCKLGAGAGKYKLRARGQGQGQGLGNTNTEFRVIQIRKSINSFLIENFPDEELISLKSRSSSETSNSAAGSLPENLQNSWDVSRNSEILSENSRVSYPSVNGQGRSTEFQIICNKTGREKG